MTTLFAPVRFKPVPPANVEIRKMKMSGFSWNSSIIGIPSGSNSNKYKENEKNEWAKTYAQPLRPTHPVEGNRSLNNGQGKISCNPCFAMMYRLLFLRWNASIRNNLIDLVKIKTLLVESWCHSWRRFSNILEFYISKSFVYFSDRGSPTTCHNTVAEALLGRTSERCYLGKRTYREFYAYLSNIYISSALDPHDQVIVYLFWGIRWSCGLSSVN